MSTLTRFVGDRFVSMTVEVKPAYTEDSTNYNERARLSIIGSYGSLVTPAAAKRMALEYWVSFFEDSPEEIYAMNKRFGTRFTSATGAAKFVLATDGSTHGLDITGAADDGRLMLTEGWGQIGDELAKTFPEFAALLPWHLNDMRAGCAHQRADNITEIDAVCPVCGYSYGSRWLFEELPTEILDLVKAFNACEA